MDRENIFEGAKFGDLFCTRDGKKAIFIRQHYQLKHLYVLVTEQFIDTSLYLASGHYRWGYHGKSQYKIPVEQREKGGLDVIGKWGDPSNEEKIKDYNKHFFDYLDKL